MTFAFNAIRFNNAMTLGIQAPNFDRREERLKLGNDGALHHTSATIVRTAPKASWSSLAVRAWFTLLGTGDEVPYVAMDGTNGLELIGFKRATDGVGYATGSVHPRRRGLSGSVFLSGVSWRPRQPLVASFDAFWISSIGSTDAIAAADLIASPTISLSQEQLALSSVLFDAVDWTAKAAALDVSYDHRAENNADPTCYQAGLPHPVQLIGVGINGQSDITLTFDTEDLDTAVGTPTTITIQAKVYTHLGVGLGATGVTMVINKPLIREEAIPGEDGSSAKRRITATGTFDGTNRPGTIATF